MSNIEDTGTGTLAVVADEGQSEAITLELTGTILLPALRVALTQLAARRAQLSRRVLVLDASKVERFGRGAVVELARWITRNAQHFDRAVTITHSPSLKSSVLALSACAPKLEQRIVSTVEEAKDSMTLRLSMTG